MENSNHFTAARHGLREKIIPTTLLDYGTLGGVLRKLSIIKTISKNNYQTNTFSQLNYKALFRIRVQCSSTATFQIYWAGMTHSYNEGFSSFVRIHEDEDEYYLKLPGLESIRWLRIDLSDKPSQVLIQEMVIEQEGYETIRFSDSNQLKQLKPIYDIRDVSAGPDGLNVISSGTDPQLEVEIFPKKDPLNRYVLPRKVLINDRLYHAVNSDGPESLPSSQVDEIFLSSSNMPLLSIVTHDNYLYDNQQGIIKQWEHRGKDWERFCYISYFDNGKLLFGTSAGIRLQGSSTRHLGANFRIYFRNRYGMKEIEPGILFTSGKTPIKRLVIETDRETPGFNNCLAFDIAKEMGCIVPEIKLSRFLLNGKTPADIPYILVEHLDKKQWEYHMGHTDFAFVRLKNFNNTVEDQQEYDDLESLISKKETLIFEEMGRYIDMDNFSRFILATVFLGNWDFDQGAAVRDHRAKDPKWFWIMWDLDVSFIDFKGWGFTGELWEQRGFPLTFMNRFFRMQLFQRLMHESEKYHGHFLRIFTDTLNHRLTPSFLNSRVSHYEKISKTISASKPYFDKRVVIEFFKRRPEFLRYELDRYYGYKYPVGKSIRCTVSGPGDIKYRID
ncbi:MAG: CotH kinase family protein, partial [Thermodesulfobacteriota bacterium]